jgi:hypothetical protein
MKPRIALVASIVALMAAGATRPVAAQAVRGRLIEAGTGQPISAASVILYTEDGQALLGKLTDADGRFLIDAPGAGRFKLTAERIGYAPVNGGPIEIVGTDTVDVVLRMGTEVIAIDGIEVVTEARDVRLERSGFYERQRMGFGHFITRDQISFRNPTRTSDLLRTIAGVQVVPRGTFGGGEPVLRGAISGMGQCLPGIILDGMTVRQAGSAEPPFDDIVHPLDIEAIEVYRGPGEVPAQFGGSQSACGVIVIWTRKG